MSEGMYPNVIRVQHPLLQTAITVLRNKETGTALFRQYAAIAASLLLAEATRTFRITGTEVETPLGPAQDACTVRDRWVLVPVLRAGLAMLPAAQAFLPDCPVGFLGLERDEQTAIAREYYMKFPAGIGDSKAIILDPMLATGGSLEETIRAVQRQGVKDVVLVCVVAAPEGIQRITQSFPQALLYTAAVDSHLNDRKFIVPGLGDFGDRYFGT